MRIRRRQRRRQHNRLVQKLATVSTYVCACVCVCLPSDSTVELHNSSIELLSNTGDSTDALTLFRSLSVMMLSLFCKRSKLVLKCNRLICWQLTQCKHTHTHTISISQRMRERERVRVVLKRQSNDLSCTEIQTTQRSEEQAILFCWYFFFFVYSRNLHAINKY